MKKKVIPGYEYLIKAEKFKLFILAANEVRV